VGKLDIDVELKAKGNQLEDGVNFIYLYTNRGDGSQYHLRDSSGNIVIPLDESSPFEIRFNLSTTQINFGGRAHTVSFRLKPDSGQTYKPPMELAQASGGTVPPGVFEIGRITNGNIGVDSVAPLVVKKRDGQLYDYTLYVGIRKPDNTVVNVKHDPKIRNGGDSTKSEALDHCTALVVATGLAIAAIAAISLYIRQRGRGARP
jgi:hypothetical protein